VSGFENWLVHHVEAWRGRIKVHGLVSNTELLSRIAEHDIGVAWETPIIRSLDLSYLLAGLAVVVSETAQSAGGGSARTGWRTPLSVRRRFLFWRRALMLLGVGRRSQASNGFRSCRRGENVLLGV